MLEFDPEPWDALTGLYDVSPALAKAIDVWIDALELDSTQAAVRRRYLRPPGLWCISIRNPVGDNDYVILWDMDGDTTVVRYVGPASFA